MTKERVPANATAVVGRVPLLLLPELGLQPPVGSGDLLELESCILAGGAGEGFLGLGPLSFPYLALPNPPAVWTVEFDQLYIPGPHLPTLALLNSAPSPAPWWLAVTG